LSEVAFVFKKMQVSKKKINPKIEKQIFGLFYQVVNDLKNPQEIRDFLAAILTKTELEAVVKRLAVAHYLDSGRTYENIKKSLAVSSATIAAVQEQIAKGKGFGLALEKIKAEEWADKWAKKISQLVKR
jgi:TrpR-related protein YerC/YecD